MRARRSSGQTETGRKYTLKTNSKGEYFSLGIAPGKYKVKLFAQMAKRYSTSTTCLSAWTRPHSDFDLKKEGQKQAGPGLTPEQIKRQQEAQAKTQKENMHGQELEREADRRQHGHDAAISTPRSATLTEATRSTPPAICSGSSWPMPTGCQPRSRPIRRRRQKRYERRSTDYQKAIDLKQAATVPLRRIPMRTRSWPPTTTTWRKHMPSRARWMMRSRTTTRPRNWIPHARPVLLQLGAVLTKPARSTMRIAAFDKAIAADPTKADCLLLEGRQSDRQGDAEGRQDGRSRRHCRSFPEVSGAAPDGHTMPQPAKDMLASIGATVETGFGKKEAGQEVAFELTEYQAASCHLFFD